MILKLSGIVVVLVAVVLLFAATRPSVFHIQRSINIVAPPEKVFALIDDFHNWNQWETRDKNNYIIERTYSGSASGQGAISDWVGKGSAGKGRMKITNSAAPSHVTVEADWVRPFTAHNINEFTLEPQGAAATKVTWAMQGTNVYLLKLMGLFMNMDRFMGSHFEAGLTNLKAAAEK